MRIIAALAAVVLAACPQPAPVGVNAATIPVDTAARCNDICRHIGLPIESVVVMADNVGCVCSAAQPAAVPAAPAAPTPAPVPTPAPTTSRAQGSGGMAAILMQQAAARSAAAAAQQQQQQQQRQRQQQQQQYHH